MNNDYNSNTRPKSNAIQWKMKTTSTVISSVFLIALLLLTVISNISIYRPADGQQEEGKIIRQGIATSSPDPLPGHEEHQSVVVLGLREDNAVYSGILTFTATQPVELQVLHRNMTTTNTTGLGISEDFGTFGPLSMLQLPEGNGQVTISSIIPDFPEDATTFSASVPFSGNSIALHNFDGEPFVVTYTVTSDVLGPAERADSLSTEPTIPPEEEQEEEEEEGVEG
jgi:hypothetical protein